MDAPTPLQQILSYYLQIILSAVAASGLVIVLLYRRAVIKLPRALLLFPVAFLTTFIYGLNWDDKSFNEQSDWVHSRVVSSTLCFLVALFIALGEMRRARPELRPVRLLLPLFSGIVVLGSLLDLYSSLHIGDEKPLLIKSAVTILITAGAAVGFIRRQVWGPYLLSALWITLLLVEIKLFGIWLIASHVTRALGVVYVLYYLIIHRETDS